MKSDTDFANPYEKELYAQESKIKELQTDLMFSNCQISELEKLCVNKQSDIDHLINYGLSHANNKIKELEAELVTVKESTMRLVESGEAYVSRVPDFEAKNAELEKKLAELDNAWRLNCDNFERKLIVAVEALEHLRSEYCFGNAQVYIDIDEALKKISEGV